ncbi:MAG: DegT/DnrJ/EryC1/StrS family aminotransferase [Solirubrobacteraceae bacterium]|nr:DegT/DnrJ/EryC1/StrS family aminotransferase [Solirubrobacteraceae bacterium]
MNETPVTEPRGATAGAGATDRRQSVSIQLSAPTFGAAELREITAAIQDGWVTGGPRVARLTMGLRSYLGVEHLTCVSSCSAGMKLALVELGVGPGDEVLVPAVTFASCANLVVHQGAVPVLVDVDPDTGLIDLDGARDAVTERTRAAFVVHLHGRPLDMDAVAAFTADTGVPVIEDAAHAIGARWRGRMIGSFGNPTAFSFHASKNMTTVDGGALVSPSRDAADRAGLLSRQGMSRPSWDRHEDEAPGAYDIVAPGFKFAMHDVAAALGIHQLKALDERTERRLQLARLYDDALADVDVRVAPPAPDHARHAMHVYAVRIPGGEARRNRVARELSRAGIGTSVHFRSLHLHTYYAESLGLEPDDLPRARAYSDESLSLPMHPGLSDGDVEQVVEALRGALGG